MERTKTILQAVIAEVGGEATALDGKNIDLMAETFNQYKDRYSLTDMRLILKESIIEENSELDHTFASPFVEKHVARVLMHLLRYKP